MALTPAATDRLTRNLRRLPALLGVLLLLGAIYAVQKEFRHLRIEDIGTALDAIPRRALVISFLWTILSYFVLTFYDRLGTIYAGHKVAYSRVAFASFCAYALSHNLGFSALSGAAVRYRLYAQWGMTPGQIARTVAFCSLTFGLGGMVLGGTILILEPQSVPFFGDVLHPAALRGIGAALWAIVAAYVTLARVVGTLHIFGHQITLPGLRMALVQVVLATVDVAITASIFYTLLPAAHRVDATLTFPVFLGIYVASYTAGLAANLPGGIGVFDTAILFGLERYLPAADVLGAIVVFRLYYYVIPLFLAGTMFAGNELLLRGGTLMKAPIAARGVQTLARWSEPDFSIAAATGAVVLSGIMLLGVGVVAPHPDFSWLDPDYADFATQAGQFIPSLIGAGLVVLAIGLSHRVNPFRASFYRHARLLAGPLEPATALSLLSLVVCLLALAGFRQHVRMLPNNAWWSVILSPEVPNSLRVSVALTVALALVAIWRLIRPGRVTWHPWNAEARLRLARFGPLPSTGADGVVWGETEQAGIAFRRCGRVLLGLGDPAGAAEDQVSAVWRLRDLAQQEGLDPAIWRAGPGLLKVYSDLGLTAVPLGPDGLPLPEADGDTPTSDQYLVCVAERDLSALLPLLPGLALAEAAE